MTTPPNIDWKSICTHQPLAYVAYKNYVIQQTGISGLKFAIDPQGLLVEHLKSASYLDPRDLYDFFDTKYISVYLKPVDPYPSCQVYFQSHKRTMPTDTVYPNRLVAEKYAFEIAFELLNNTLKPKAQ